MSEPAAPPGTDAETAGFAAAWAAAVTDTSYVTLTVDELRDYLHELSAVLLDVAHGRAGIESAHEVGAALVRSHFTEVDTLSATVRVIGTQLPGVRCGSEPSTRQRERVAAVCAAVSAGYARALRSRTLDEQESISQAALRARDRAEAALRVSEARFRAIFASAGVGMAITDLDGTLLDVNEAVCALMGYRADELCGRNVFDFVLPEAGGTDTALYEQQARGERETYQRHRRLHRADGEVRWVRLAASLIRDERGEPSYQVSVVEDVTERLRLRESLRRQSMRDSLTGLANRTTLLEWLAERMEVPGGRGVAVGLLNLDGFKMVNDSLGHDVGDELLGEVASRLRTAVSGEHRLLVRMGGDEFAIAAADCSTTKEMVAIAREALGSLHAPFRIAGQELSISARAGIVARPLVSGTAAELVRDADITLGWAKADGSRLTVYDPDRNAGELARYGLAAAMPAALEAGEFYVDYQPLVRLSDGHLVGVEALVRWWHPELGRLGPDRFIGLAEETGLITSLGQWVLEEACAKAGAWYREFGDRAPFMSVNLAVRQVQQPGIVDTVKRVLADSGLPPERLQLELTESAIMESSGEPLRTLRALAGLGPAVAIDDFGTGYSNLAYLRHLPARVLKLAGSFVEGLAEGSEQVDGAIVSGLVTLAHALDLSVTAEGVETRDQAGRLREIGCEYGQGWLYSRPVPPEDIERMLR